MVANLPPQYDRYAHRPYYVNTVSTTSLYYSWVDVVEDHRSKARRKLDEMIRKFGAGMKLAAALRKKEANARAAADRKSRQHHKPARGLPAQGVRLFPYQMAMAARFSPRTRER
jgi:hypothetical protein